MKGSSGPPPTGLSGPLQEAPGWLMVLAPYCHLLAGWRTSHRNQQGPAGTRAPGGYQVVGLAERHLADHVVEDASVVEVGQLHVRVQAHPDLERPAVVQLWGQRQSAGVTHLRGNRKPQETKLQQTARARSFSGTNMASARPPRLNTSRERLQAPRLTQTDPPGPGGASWAPAAGAG